MILDQIRWAIVILGKGLRNVRKSSNSPLRSVPQKTIATRRATLTLAEVTYTNNMCTPYTTVCALYKQ